MRMCPALRSVSRMRGGTRTAMPLPVPATAWREMRPRRVANAYHFRPIPVKLSRINRVESRPPPSLYSPPVRTGPLDPERKGSPNGGGATTARKEQA